MIVISSTFVAEPLEVPLAYLLAEAGLDAGLQFAPYHQIFQQLLTPGSEFERNRSGVNVALIRLEDFVRDQGEPDDACQVVSRIADELAAALERFVAAGKGTVLLSLLSPSERLPALVAAAIETASAMLLARVASQGGIQVLSAQEIDRVASAERFDAKRDELAHIPFSDAYFAALALALARRIHALRVPAAKVLVLDCDNTLWRGVVGEDGVDGVVLSEPFLALQQFAVEQQRKGVLICLASKNSEADVLDVMQHRKDMRLRSSDVVAHRINWLPKSANLRSLAEELNLGLDAFVFFDDNPMECARMRAELPQVVTLQVPAEEAMVDWLAGIWNFDKPAVTAEDAQRTQMYRENAARRSLESSVGDIREFMVALNLQVDIQKPTDDEWPRISQLTQRTNQFNFTTRRRSEQELKTLVTEGAEVLRVRVSDRFGDYGLVGVLIAQSIEQAWEVDSFLLSCRVLGRGVEHAMLRRLGEDARERGLDLVRLRVISSARNEPARAFVDSVAAAHGEPSPDGWIYRVPLAQAVEIQHRPGHDPAAVLEARLADERKGADQSTPSATPVARSQRYERLASVLVSGEAVVQQLAQQGRRARSMGTAIAAAASPIEAGLKALWEEVLLIDGIGVEDDYFALGGTSLQSVKLFSEVERRFGVQLRLTTILAAPTVRSLARLIVPTAAAARDGLVLLKPGLNKNLFLVHDGLGETLLYLNLAQRLPGAFSVYGIEPRRLPGIALAHATVEDMADYYVEQIRSTQAHGPYRLGGMCAGGVIAYEMAAQLRREGEEVEVVLILDGATPQAAHRAGRIASGRRSRMRALMQGNQARGVTLKSSLALAGAVARKVWNTAIYESSAFLTRISARLRFALLQRLVRLDRPWPVWVPRLTVAQIYTALELRYLPPALSDVPVLLIRASQGVDADTPYRDIYSGEDFGWRAVAGQLMLADVAGGHASMLQHAHVDSLASSLLAQLPAWSEVSVGGAT